MANGRLLVRALLASAGLASFVVLGLPATGAAGERAAHAYPYTLVDLGTFGGPQSFPDLPAEPISQQGIVLGTADTTVADNSYPNNNPFVADPPDPLIVHAFAWSKGRLSRPRGAAGE